MATDGEPEISAGTKERAQAVLAAHGQVSKKPTPDESLSDRTQRVLKKLSGKEVADNTPIALKPADSPEEDRSKEEPYTTTPTGLPMYEPDDPGIAYRKK